MTRDFKTELILLKAWPVGERHRGLKALSPQLGLVSLIQFGGQSRSKGRRDGTEPFCYGVAQLYKDPRYQGWQIKDFELLHSFPGNREDLQKFYIQNLWAEVHLSSHGGGGDFQLAFDLMLNSMSQLEKADKPEQQDKVLIYFILRFLSLQGMVDFYRNCGSCGEKLVQGEPLFFDLNGHYCCPRCARESMIPLSPGALAFLRQLDQCRPEDLPRMSLASASRERLREWMLKLLQTSLDRKLKTLKFFS